MASLPRGNPDRCRLPAVVGCLKGQESGRIEPGALRAGAKMMVTYDETAGGRGGKGDGLPGSTVDTRVEGVLGSIKARAPPQIRIRAC